MIKLVGHRGLPESFPENSIEGVEAAFDAGAAAVEVDIQFSKDAEPMLFHDDSLARVTGLSGQLAAFEESLLNKMGAHEADRFGEQFLGTRIHSLKELVPIMQQRPDKMVFVEVKEDSFEYIDRDSVIAKLAIILAPIATQTVIISYDLPILRKVRDSLEWPVGWVVRHYCEQSAYWASDFQPDYMISNIDKLPKAGSLWQGLWEWFVYDVTCPEKAIALAKQGVHWVESWDVKGLMENLDASNTGGDMIKVGRDSVQAMEHE